MPNKSKNLQLSQERVPEPSRTRLGVNRQEGAPHTIVTSGGKRPQQDLAASLISTTFLQVRLVPV